MSLVPDYGSGSSNDESTDSDKESEESEKNLPAVIVSSSVQLPSASSIFAGTGKIGQVFNNPFKVAETTKIASLEKHVKMVETEDNITIKNGKKICWNYRKGRCRFGSKCTFAHDSDVQRTEEVQTEVPKEQSTEEANKTNLIKTKKSGGANKRPGLTNSIIPSKKVMKGYNNQKSYQK